MEVIELMELNRLRMLHNARSGNWHAANLDVVVKCLMISPTLVNVIDRATGFQAIRVPAYPIWLIACVTIADAHRCMTEPDYAVVCAAVADRVVEANVYKYLRTSIT